MTECGRGGDRRRSARSRGGECAAQFGMPPHVVERSPRLMGQQLDEAGGALLSRMVGALGITMHLDVGTGVDRASRRRRASRVTLSDGSAGRRGRGDLRGGRAAARRAGPRRGAADRRPRWRADRFGLRHDRSRRLRDRRGRGDRGPLLRAGRPGIHQRRSGRRPIARRRSRIRRGRHVDQAEAARRRRGELRRRDGHHAGLPRGGRSTTPSARPTPSWCSPTMPGTLLGGILVGDARPTACCGRWWASGCPGTPWRSSRPADPIRVQPHSASARCQRRLRSAPATTSPRVISPTRSPAAARTCPP